MPKRTDISTILIIGAGPIVIGQACEFDYSGTQAVKDLWGRGQPAICGRGPPVRWHGYGHGAACIGRRAGGPGQSARLATNVIRALLWPILRAARSAAKPAACSLASMSASP